MKHSVNVSNAMSYAKHATDINFMIA